MDSVCPREALWVPSSRLVPPACSQASSLSVLSGAARNCSRSVQFLFYLKILFWEFFFLLFSPCSLLSTEVPQRPLPTVPTPSFTFRWPCSHGLSVEARGCLSRLLTSFAPHVPHHRALLLRVWGWHSWKEDVEVQQRVLGLSHSVICVY